MNSQMFLAGSVWGLLLGFFYFGGLWLTVQRVSRSGKPKRLLLVSFVVRIAAVMTGFWFILHYDPAGFGVTLAAFFLVRIVMTRLIRRPQKEEVYANQP